MTAVYHPVLAHTGTMLRKSAWVLPLCMAAFAWAPAGAAALDCSALSSPIYQVINPTLQTNLLTPWQNEATSASQYGFTQSKGAPFRASVTPANGLVAAHRLYNAASSDFIWMVNPAEITSATWKYGYADQGINFYVSPSQSSCTQPVYRFVKGNVHRFAVSQADRNALAASGWASEGVKFYGGIPSDDSSMPIGDLDGWRQIFTEDFTTPAPLGKFTSAYGARWDAYPSPWTDTSGRGVYNPAKVLSVSNGVLDWYLHTENGTHYVGAVVPKLPGQSNGAQIYGKYTFRFRADTIPGYKLVVILWPESDNWGEGEIDFPEVGELIAGKDGLMYAYLHAPGAYAQSESLPTGIMAADTGWHIGSIEWRRSSLTYYLDGRLIGTQTSGVPSTPLHLVFQMETNIGGPAPSASAAGHIQLDWVSIYAPK
jgi:hypothetical protein